MPASTRSLCGLLLAFGCAASLAQAVEFPRYAVKRWAEPGFARAYRANAMNASDEIVGGAWQGAPDFDTVGFRASPVRGLLKVDGIDQPPTPRILALFGINDSGAAVGHADVYDADEGMRYIPVHVAPDGRKTWLNRDLPPDVSAQARAINAAGVIVGGASRFNRDTPLMWDTPQAAPRQMVFPAGMKNLWPAAINASGHVAGTSGTPMGKGFLWKGDGVAVEIPQVIQVHAVNDHDAVVGQRSGHWAFVWTAGRGMERLPHLPKTNQCDANSINNAGTVVGYCGYYNGEVLGRQRATVWIRGDQGWAVADLTERVPGPNPTHDLTSAMQINEAGHILVQREAGHVGDVNGPLVLIPEGGNAR